MTDEQLIQIAKRLGEGFARTESDRAIIARLAEVQVRAAAMIQFREPGNKNQSMDVYLDRDTGEFITASFSPGHD